MSVIEFRSGGKLYGAAKKNGAYWSIILYDGPNGEGRDATPTLISNPESADEILEKMVQARFESGNAAGDHSGIQR